MTFKHTIITTGAVYKGTEFFIHSAPPFVGDYTIKRECEVPMNNLMPIVHKNQRVLTTQQLAGGYETEPQIIRNNFNRNKDRYVSGVDYFLLEGAEFHAFRATNQIDLPQNISSMYLWTEMGAFLHAKSLSTDKAWDVYHILVNTYFKARELLKPLSPIDALAQTVQILQEQDRKIQQITGTVNIIKETIITQPDNWREDLNRMINRIAIIIGNSRYRDLRNESYALLESRAHVDLNRRLDNLRARKLKEGASKTAINETCKLDVIEQDPKLREIYAKIIQEYTVKFVA